MIHNFPIPLMHSPHYYPAGMHLQFQTSEQQFFLEKCFSLTGFSVLLALRQYFPFLLVQPHTSHQYRFCLLSFLRWNELFLMFLLHLQDFLVPYMYSLLKEVLLVNKGF
ncbi:hypothetical protein ES703_93449 [subsurface metagenome]